MQHNDKIRRSPLLKYPKTISRRTIGVNGEVKNLNIQITNDRRFKPPIPYNRRK